VIDAAKAWRNARSDDVPSPTAERLCRALDALASIESLRPQTISDLDDRALFGITAAAGSRITGDRRVAQKARSKTTPRKVFDIGLRAIRNQKYVGARTIEEIEGVLRANGFDVNDWRAR
jgi:hypothetical protein